MKVWDRAIETSKRFLAQLSVTQRLLVGSLATVIVLVLFVVQQYSAGVAMTALFPGAPGEDQAQAERFLQAGNFEYETVDGEVRVPADRWRAIIASMAEVQALPSDNKLLFEQLIKDQSWTRDQSDKHQAEVVALQNELAAIIGRMRGIRSANVIVDVPRNRTLGQPSRAPTASVTVFSSNGIEQATADAVAELVASSRAGLSVDRVTVVDGTTNRRFRARSAEDLSIGTNLELALRIEAEAEEKIYEALSGIPNIVVAVRAQVDATRKRRQTNSVLPVDQGSISVPVRETTSELETRMITNAGEGGVRSNTGVSVETGGGAGTVTTETTTELESELAEGRANEDVLDPRGFARKLNAVVNIPEPAVAALWKSRNPVGADADAEGGGGDGGAGGAGAGAGEPSAEDLRATFAALRDDIIAIVTPLIATDLNDGGETGEVTVTMMPVIPDLALIPGGAGGGGVLGLPIDAGDLGGAVKTGLLAMLALVSMGLVVMTALRASKRERLPSAEDLVGIPPALQDELDLMGEASEVDAALEGRELTEDEVRAQQLFSQVKELVKERPEDAAALVMRWMREDE
ncbi:MAG: hypothetical protein ACTS3F_06980 [Phycisphaerales bacterium]